MNIVSLLFIVSLLPLLMYALYIDYCRTGRDTRGHFAKKTTKRSQPLFYSDLRRECEYI